MAIGLLTGDERQEKNYRSDHPQGKRVMGTTIPGERLYSTKDFRYKKATVPKTITDRRCGVSPKRTVYLNFPISVEDANEGLEMPENGKELKVDLNEKNSSLFDNPDIEDHRIIKATDSYEICPAVPQSEGKINVTSETVTSKTCCAEEATASITLPAIDSKQSMNSNSKLSTINGGDFGKQSAGGDNDSSQREQQNAQQQQQKNRNKKSSSRGDKSLPGSGDAGDGRRGDDGEKDEDERKRYSYTKVDGTEEKEEVEEEEVEEEEEEEEKSEEINEDQTVAAKEDQKDGVTQKITGNSVEKDEDCVKGMTELMIKLKIGRTEEANVDEMQQQECSQTQNEAEICRGLEAALRNNDRNINLQLHPTPYLRSGNYYLKHLQMCSLGHYSCEDCHQYLQCFEILISRTPKEDLAVLFPFIQEFKSSNTQEEKYLTIMKWLYERLPEKSLKYAMCKATFKRLRLSGSSQEGPKKKQKFSELSTEPMDTAAMPSPEERPTVALNQSTNHAVVHGSKDDIKCFVMNCKNSDTVDGVFNEGVLLNEQLRPRNRQYRPEIEFISIRRLGSGTSGEAYLATDSTTNQEFVYKVVPINRFNEDEVLIWSQLDHPHIVPLYGVVRHGSNIFMISEYIASRPLLARRGESASFRDIEIIQWLRQLLDVLIYIHALGIVHMDIKPDNLLLTEDGIKVIDWGLAVRLNDNGVKLLGHPIGTEVFMAKEIVLCEQFDATVDVYSLLCLAINLFTGIPPWVKRYPGLPTYKPIIKTSGPPIEDIPCTLDVAIQKFLIDAFKCRPRADELKNHEIFYRDSDFQRNPEPCIFVDKPEIEMEIDQFPKHPIPPPDGQSTPDYSNLFQVLGNTLNIIEPNIERKANQAPVRLDRQEGISVNQQTSGPFDRQDETSNVNHQAPIRLDRQEGISIHQQTSGPLDRQDKTCNVNQQAPVRLYRQEGIKTLQALGHASRPQDLPIRDYRQHSTMQDTQIDELNSSFQNLSIKSDDLYGPGPPKQFDIPLTVSAQNPPGSSALQTPDRSSCSSSQFELAFPCLGDPSPEIKPLSADNQAESEESASHGTDNNLQPCAASTPNSFSQPPTRSTSANIPFENSVDMSDYFSCLGSTPDTNNSEKKFGQSHTPPEEFLRRLSFSSKDQEEAVEKLYSELNFGLCNDNEDFLNTLRSTAARNTTSGFVTEESSVHSSLSPVATVQVNIFGQEMTFECNGLMSYGQFAIFISTEVFRICRDRNIRMTRFLLQDNFGNLFGSKENVRADKIIIEEAEVDGDWAWCITLDDTGLPNLLD